MPRPSPEIKDANTTSVKTFYPSGSQTYTNRKTEVYRRTWSGSNTPGFPGVKPLPFNSHTVEMRKRALGSLSVRRQQYENSTGTGNYLDVGSSDLAGLSRPSVASHVGGNPLTQEGDTIARSRCIANIQRLKANVAQNMAEYRQVSRMFLDTTRRFTNIMTALRRGDPRELTRELQLRKRHQRNLLARGPFDIRSSAPRIWLEAQYGWLPLVGDVYTGITNFHRRVEEGYRIKAVGTCSRTTVSTAVQSPSSVISCLDVTRRKHRHKYIIEYEVDAAYLANANDWGVTNPALLAWELVPYSFVVDWFLPVGDWLSQVGYSLGLHFYRGMRTGIVEAETMRVFKAGAPHSDFIRSVKGSESFTSVYFRRATLGDFPSPGKPKFDPSGLRGKRILNALSLLAVAFDR